MCSERERKEERKEEDFLAFTLCNIIVLKHFLF